MSDITAIMDLAKTIGSEHPGGTALVPRSTENLLDTDDLFVERTDLSVALPVLLSALGWHGNRRNLAEAVPLDTETLDLTGLRNLMANLNYRSRPARVSLDEVEPAFFPCLFLPERGDACPSSKHLGHLGLFLNGGSGSS